MKTAGALGSWVLLAWLSVPAVAPIVSAAAAQPAPERLPAVATRSHTTAPLQPVPDPQPRGPATWWAGAATLLAALGGGWFAWRRSAGGLPLPRRARKDRAVARLSSQALTPHASVHAIRWNGEELLIGCTAQQITVLSRQPGESTQGGEA